LGIHIDGCFAEYVKVPLKKIYKIPVNVSYRLASLTEPLAVAVHDVRRSRLAVGETALVIGGGPIGLLIAMVARYAGASRVVISEPNKYRIGIAQALGFEVIDPLASGSEEELMGRTDGEGYDVVFESSGTMPGAALMTKAAKIVGRVIVVGIPRTKPEVDTGAIFAKELDVLGVRIHSQLSFAAAVDVLGKGDLNTELESLITNEFALEEIQKALDFSQEDDKHIKVVLKV
jgi:2-desacetyl-2-hydroxyethyl bacteriochlorophyllide A dehydrogenase